MIQSSAIFAEQNRKIKMYRRPGGLYEKIIIINGKRKAFRGKTDKEVMRKIAEYNIQQKQRPLFETVV